jgi:hypothetical protein
MPNSRLRSSRACSAACLVIGSSVLDKRHAHIYISACQHKYAYPRKISMTPDEVRDILRQECERAGSQSAWAKEKSIGTAYVSDVITGRRDPGAKLLAALGLKRMVCYFRDRPEPEGQGNHADATQEADR